MLISVVSTILQMVVVIYYQVMSEIVAELYKDTFFEESFKIKLYHVTVNSLDMLY